MHKFIKRKEKNKITMWSQDLLSVIIKFLSFIKTIN